MKRVVVCALLVAWGAVAADTGTAGEVAGACAPDSVVSQLFARLRAGDGPGAEKLFRVVGPAQDAAVRDYVTGGIKFFRQAHMSTRTVEVFTVGAFAICALEQTSPDSPGRRELECGCLVLVDDCWRLLPQPQDHRSVSNELSAHEISTFDLLKKEFDAYKKEYKKYYSLNKGR